MLFRLKLFNVESEVIETTYDKASLPYLLMYVMGKYEQTHEGEALSPQLFAEKLLKSYPRDFYKTTSDNGITFDILQVWEKYCDIWNVIESIDVFKSSSN